jgi:hypothetical protein
MTTMTLTIEVGLKTSISFSWSGGRAQPEVDPQRAEVA